jgi:hypothetical protein
MIGVLYIFIKSNRYNTIKIVQKNIHFQESKLVFKNGHPRDCPFFDTSRKSWEECLPYWVGNNLNFYIK